MKPRVAHRRGIHDLGQRYPFADQADAEAETQMCRVDLHGERMEQQRRRAHQDRSAEGKNPIPLHQAQARQHHGRCRQRPDDDRAKLGMVVAQGAHRSPPERFGLRAITQ